MNIVVIAGKTRVSPSVAGSVRSQVDARARVSVISASRPQRELVDVDHLVVVGGQRPTASSSTAQGMASLLGRVASAARTLIRRATSLLNRARGRGAVGRRLAREVSRSSEARRLLARADVIVALDGDAVGAAWLAARRHPAVVATLGIPAAAHAVAMARGDA